jgi:nicotinate-nucleotide adenylyltransferase
MRIAVFGGTFDPPHNGHIKLAQFIIANNYAEQVLFVPAYDPPHKSNIAISSFEHRVAMLKLAIGSNDRFIITLIEQQERRSPSYTYDTMESLEDCYPDDELLVVIGYDSMIQLHTWFRGAEIIRRWQLLTYPRANKSMTDKFRLSDWWSDEECDILSESVIDAEILQISSTEIRNRLVESAEINNFIAEKVREYIIEHDLYTIG